jgi:hypothetical protein
MTAAEEMVGAMAMATVMATATATTTARMVARTARRTTMMAATVAGAFLPAAAMAMLVPVLCRWLLGAYIPYESYRYV